MTCHFIIYAFLWSVQSRSRWQVATPRQAHEMLPRWSILQLPSSMIKCASCSLGLNSWQSSWGYKAERRREEFQRKVGTRSAAALQSLCHKHCIVQQRWMSHFSSAVGRFIDSYFLQIWIMRWINTLGFFTILRDQTNHFCLAELSTAKWPPLPPIHIPLYSHVDASDVQYSIANIAGSMLMEENSRSQWYHVQCEWWRNNAF